MKAMNWLSFKSVAAVVIGISLAGLPIGQAQEKSISVPASVHRTEPAMPGEVPKQARTPTLPLYKPSDPKMAMVSAPLQPWYVERTETEAAKVIDTSIRTLFPWKDELQAATRANVPLVRQPTVFGSDDRILVTNTTTFPWSAVCQLEITYPKGRSTGTGFFVSSRTVLTCGHCVYDSRYGGWATRIRVIPGRNGRSEPLGSAWASQLYCADGWFQGQQTSYDYGAIILSSSTLGNRAGRFGADALGTADLTNPNNNFTTAGYPADKGSINMYATYGPFANASDRNLYYYFDIMGGQSGSPIWYRDGATGRRFVVGIVSAEILNGRGPNIATRVTPDVISLIRSLP